MDWIESVIEKLKLKIKNLSFRKALLSYILIAAVFAAALSYITIAACTRAIRVKYNQYYEVQDAQGEAEGEEIQNPPTGWMSWSGMEPVFAEFEGAERSFLIFINFLRVWSPFIYCLLSSGVAVLLFYRSRMKRPLKLLEDNVQRIKEQDLEQAVIYDSEDEIGRLAALIDNMRLELVKDKMHMWELVDNQKKLNEAFAHDMRTPLTVMKGYTDFLYRYLPEGTLSTDKTMDTLRLISNHLKRLEDFSRTMHGIRSMDEREAKKERTTISALKKMIGEILFALNQVGDVELTLQSDGSGDIAYEMLADTNLMLEVLENLLSNAIRYARKRITVFLTLDVETHMLVLTVKDDGDGFSKDMLQSGLLPYKKEEGANQGGEEHFGIGLSIAKGLSKKHGGTLSIANSIDGGAVVSASFYVDV